MEKGTRCVPRVVLGVGGVNDPRGKGREGGVFGGRGVHDPRWKGRSILVSSLINIIVASNTEKQKNHK